MVKLVFAGLWVCIITLGAVFFSVRMATAPVAAPEAEAKAPTELVRGESITVPMIASGGVKGYFLGRISFMVNKEKLKGANLPMTEVMTDELFTLLVGNKMVDLADTQSFDLAAFREAIKADINKRLGDGLVDEVLVEQLDYLSKEDVRATSEAPKSPTAAPVKIVEGVKVQDPANH